MRERVCCCCFVLFLPVAGKVSVGFTSTVAVFPNKAIPGVLLRALPLFMESWANFFLSMLL